MHFIHLYRVLSKGFSVAKSVGPIDVGFNVSIFHDKYKYKLWNGKTLGAELSKGTGTAGLISTESWSETIGSIYGRWDLINQKPIISTPISYDVLKRLETHPKNIKYDKVIVPERITINDKGRRNKI